MTPQTPLSLGLQEGLGYAATHRGDRSRLGRIARAHTAEDVAATVGATFAPPDEIADTVAYWSGFAHGVRSFLLEERNRA
jgi:hypothetical protein